jgi:hypothetical protein
MSEPTHPPAIERDEITGVRLSPDVAVSILHELREQRAAIEGLSRSSWLAYAQEIGRSTLPGGVRVDVVLVLGVAAAAGLLGSAGDVGALLRAWLGPVAP